MRRGEVVEFDEHVGLGTVRDEDGTTWRFHCTRIVDGSRTVPVGAQVVFDVGPGGPGQWEAVTVLTLR